MSRKLTAAIAALVVGAALLGPPGGAGAVPGTPSIYFDPDETAWVAYRDQTPTQYRLTSLLLRSSYYPVDLEVDAGNRIGVVWQANPEGRQWTLKRDLTSAEYADYWQEQSDAGFRVVEQETYRKDGRQLWAGIWMREDGDHAWRSNRGMSTARVDARMEEARADGLMPVDIDQYATSNGRRWAVVWASASSSDWTFVRDLTKSQFGAAFADNAGKRVISFESVELAGVQRYAGVFVQVTNGRAYAFRRDMSARFYENWTHRYADLGYRIVGLDRYETANGPRYAVMWRQNSVRPDWEHRSQVDSWAEAVVGDTLGTSPGVAVAVYVGGVPVYLRGFGIADEAGTWMDSTHIGSIGSVSKAVAGVLAFRMRDLGEVELDDPTRDWVPTMPAHHTHTVGQLISNRGCVRYYNEGLPREFEGEDYNTALEASEEFWDGSLWCDPTQPPPVDHYSSHGYTLLGAALEAAGGDGWKTLVRDRLVGPFDLGTLGPQRDKGHLMGLYSVADGKWVKRPDNDWKVLGGGLDSSVADLAELGSKLAREQILDAKSLDEMWTPPDTVSDYAYGWVTDTYLGLRVAEKSGSWKGTNAHLWIHPGYDVSVAVIMNDQDADATTLARKIGEEIVSSVVP